MIMQIAMDYALHLIVKYDLWFETHVVAFCTGSAYVFSMGLIPFTAYCYALSVPLTFLLGSQRKRQIIVNLITDIAIALKIRKEPIMNSHIRNISSPRPILFSSRRNQM